MKNYRVYISLLVLLSIAIVTSCKKESVPPNFHYTYFDLTPGRYIDYDVMEIDHDINAAIEHDTSRYQLRTLIGDTVIDNEGRIARKFIRFKRPNSSSGWEQTDLWTAIITDNRAELVEENQRIIKLVFAPTITKEWNINAFNMYPETNVYYDLIHDPKTLGALTFDSTLVVEIADVADNLIKRERKFEVYAKGVGLVRRYYKDINIMNFDTLNVTGGTESFYTCIGFGVQ